MKKVKIHSDKWFEEQEKRIREPFKNTEIYYKKWKYIFLAIFIVTKDYYHGWLGFLQSILNLSIFGKLALTWEFALSLLIWIVIITAQITTLVLTLKSLYKFKKYKQYLEIYQIQSSDYMGSAKTITYVGAPGCGKTFMGATTAFKSAQIKYEKLKFDYYTMQSMLDYWINTANVEKLQEFEAISASYEFYAERENDFIPCLITSTPLEDQYGRRSYILTDEIFMQIKRAPEYSVMFSDESGLTQGCDKSKSIEDEVKDFWRFKRHFGDFININTEQGEDGNAKPTRKSTDYNCYLLGQEWLLKPNFLLKLLQKRQNKFYMKSKAGEYSEEEEKYIGQELYYQAQYIKTIGFRRIPFKMFTADKNRLFIGEGMYVVPAIGEVFYYDRSYRNQYKAKDMEINLIGFSSMIIDDIDLRAFDKQMTKN